MLIFQTRRITNTNRRKQTRSSTCLLRAITAAAGRRRSAGHAVADPKTTRQLDEAESASTRAPCRLAVKNPPQNADNQRLFDDAEPSLAYIGRLG
jgi:hypothetical protein